MLEWNNIVVFMYLYYTHNKGLTTSIQQHKDNDVLFFKFLLHDDEYSVWGSFYLQNRRTFTINITVISRAKSN